MNIKNITTSPFVNLKFNCKKSEKRMTDNNNISFAGYEYEKIDTQEFVKFMNALRAQGGIDKVCEKKVSDCNMQIQKLASMVEDSINSGLEGEIFKHHKFVDKIFSMGWGENNGVYKTKSGKKFSFLYDFRTIKIEQQYKLKEEQVQQNAFAYCYNCTPDRVEYDFKNYNLDDEHGNTEALILDNKLLYVETSLNTHSPYRIRYSYDKNGKLKQAKLKIYDKEREDLKEFVLVFDKNRKVSKIYYDIKTSTNDLFDNDMVASKVYKRNEQGEFELLMENTPYDN